jgi:hypothetical protein
VYDRIRSTASSMSDFRSRSPIARQSEAVADPPVDTRSYCVPLTIIGRTRKRTSGTRASALVASTLSRAPGPAHLHLYLEREAQKRSNQDDGGERAYLLERPFDDHRANDVRGDEEFEPAENGRAVDLLRIRAVWEESVELR